MGLFGPSWWHHHGIKMRVESIDPQTGFLEIKSTAATLRIQRTETKGKWLVEWEVKFSGSEKSSGNVLFSDEDLAEAFGLRSRPTALENKWLLMEYSAGCAKQGKFIRAADYLNIPCPGTGHDGDPNISIEITTDMVEAVSNLLRK